MTTPSPISRRRFLSRATLAGGLLGTGFPLNSLFANNSPKSRESTGEFSISEKEKGLAFLFQGDSITDGNWGRNMRNYNRSLTDLNHYLGHGYVYAVASRFGADFPQANFRFHNRGVGGEGIVDIEKRWQKDAIEMKPDVLGLLVGVNDVLAIIRNRTNARNSIQFAETYRQLLQRAQTANPKIVFVLGAPFLYSSGNYGKINPEKAKEEILKHAEVVRTIAKEFDGILVDYPAMFSKACQRAPIEHWIWDGCHPTPAGHEIMAREWIKQFSTRFNFAKSYRY